jgi:hypothetical protein
MVVLVDRVEPGALQGQAAMLVLEAPVGLAEVVVAPETEATVEKAERSTSPP